MVRNAVTRGHARRLGWRLGRVLKGGRRSTVYYVVDGVDWSFDWDGRYITAGLREACRQPAESVVKPRRLFGEIVHFGSRYRFIDAASRPIHRYNRVFVTWFHGAANDPEMKPLFDAFMAVAHEADKIVVPCTLTLAPLLALGLEREQFAIIPLGVELSRFQAVSAARKRMIRKRLGVPDGAFVIGSFQKDGVGWGDGLEPKRVKGPDVLLDTVAALMGRHANLFVLLTGPARGFVKNGLDKIGVRYRHAQLDHYHGIVPWYQALDLYIIASRCEGGPKALLEAWACGIPLVATRVGMVADLATDGVNALLAESEDSARLSENALRIIEDRTLGARLADAGQRTVGAYDWTASARRHMDELYAPIVGATAH